MNINIPDRQRALVIAAGAVVALFVLDSIVFTPLTNVWKTHSVDTVRLQKSVSDGRVTIARATQTQRLWKEMEDNALPKDSTQAEQDVYSALTRWSVANNIEVSNFKPQMKRGATDKYSLYEFRLDAVGTLPNISRFLYELEHTPMALRVDSVELSSRDDGGSKLALGLIVSGLRLTPLERERKLQ